MKHTITILLILTILIVGCSVEEPVEEPKQTLIVKPLLEDGSLGETKQMPQEVADNLANQIDDLIEENEDVGILGIYDK